MTLDTKKLEKQFFSDGYKLAAHAVDSRRTKEALFSATGKMYQAIDDMIQSLLFYAEGRGQKTDCKKGCASCCYQPVYALTYELEYLQDHIRNTFSVEKQNSIAMRAQQKRESLQGLEKKELACSKHPCPLLEEGNCIAYDARPVACRIYISTDVKSCLHFCHSPHDDTKYPALLSFPMRLGRMMNQGFKTALKTYGMKVEELRIEEGI